MLIFCFLILACRTYGIDIVLILLYTILILNLVNMKWQCCNVAQSSILDPLKYICWCCFFF